MRNSPTVSKTPPEEIGDKAYDALKNAYPDQDRVVYRLKEEHALAGAREIVAQALEEGEQGVDTEFIDSHLNPGHPASD